MTLSPSGLRIGECLDQRYQVERLISRGGMGAVFAARDLSRSAPVAIKVILPELLSPTDLARFEREAQLAARVDRHGGVVRVHAFGAHHGLPYCVMELVDGHTLQAVFEQEAPLETQRLATLLARVAHTLAACHAEDVIHRDLKPANIIVQPDGTPKVADFGLARDVTAERMTHTGELLGTPSYMAPEQAMDSARAIGAAVDIYALGAILYHGLTGQPPFEGNVMLVLSRLVSKSPPRPSRLNPDVSSDLEAVCLQAMAKHPDDRYVSMHTLAQDLERAARGEPVEARPLGRWQAFQRGLARRDRRAITTVAATLAALFTLLIGVGFYGLYVAPRQQARTAVAEYPTWEKEHLDPFSLGLGQGDPPDASELEQWRERLTDARAVLGEEEGEHVAQDMERLDATLLLIAHREGQEVDVDATAGPTHAQVAALLLAERGELRAGLEQLKRSPPGDRRVEAELRGRLLEQEPGPEHAWTFLTAAAGLEANPSRARLAARLMVRAIITEQLTASQPKNLKVELRRVSEALESALGGAPPSGMWLACRRDALTDSAGAIGRRLRRIKTVAQARVSVERLRLLTSACELRAPGPRIEAELGAALEALLPRPPAGRLAIWLDLLLFHELGWSAPSSKAYESKAMDEIHWNSRKVGRIPEANLIGLRRGWLPKLNIASNIDYIAKAVDGESLAGRYPRSRAALFCRHAVSIKQPGLKRERKIELCRLILAGEIADLGTNYLVITRLWLGDTLENEGYDQREKEPRLTPEIRALAGEMTQLARTSRPHGDALLPRPFRKTWTLEAAARRLLRDHTGARLLYAEATAAFNRRIERLSGTWDDDRRDLELLQLGDLLRERGEHLDRNRRPAAEILPVIRQLIRTCEAVKSNRHDDPWKYRTWAAEYLRRHSRLDEAWKVIEPGFEGGRWQSSRFIVEAVRVARALRRKEDAVRFLRAGLGRYPNSDRLLEEQEKLRRKGWIE